MVTVEPKEALPKTVFDTVRKEGVLLSRDNPGSWGSQAMDLAPAQGGYVEFVPAEDGMYPFVTHAFNFVESRRARHAPSWRWRADSLNPMAYPPSPAARSEHGAQPCARPRYDSDAATWSNM